jgi:hypothetical protein
MPSNKENQELFRLESISDSINNYSFPGYILKQEYEKLFGKEITNVSVSGGTNRDHYDLKIYHSDGTSKKCEEKSTIYYKEDISSETKPWEFSVQVYNGVGKGFQIGFIYAKLWYKHNIAPGIVKKNYQIESPIPTEQEWLKKDAWNCGNPRTQYGKELKNKFKCRHGETSMNGKSKNGYLENEYDYREPVLEDFYTIYRQNEEIKKGLISEIQEKLKKIFNEKECYLQTTGDINTDEFNFQWYEQIKVPTIQDVVLNTKKADATFDIITDVTENYSMVLRFGKGTGFSNIRIDIR